MKRIPSLCLCLVLAVGCQQKDEPAKAKAAPGAPSAGSAARADAPYKSDIEKLCDVVVRSGADQVPVEDRPLPIANWLAANLETAESKNFLVRINPLEGEPKAQALEDEARRVGLPGCALAAEWRTP